MLVARTGTWFWLLAKAVGEVVGELPPERSQCCFDLRLALAGERFEVGCQTSVVAESSKVEPTRAPARLRAPAARNRCARAECEADQNCFHLFSRVSRGAVPPATVVPFRAKRVFLDSAQFRGAPASSARCAGVKPAAQRCTVRKLELVLRAPAFASFLASRRG